MTSTNCGTGTASLAECPSSTLVVSGLHVTGSLFFHSEYVTFTGLSEAHIVARSLVSCVFCRSLLSFCAFLLAKRQKQKTLKHKHLYSGTNVKCKNENYLLPGLYLSLHV
jgi:hypothetical protein